MTTDAFSRTTRKIRSAVGYLEFRRTPLDIPLILFFLASFVGVWTAYSVRLALYKLWVIVAALAIYYLVTAVPRRYAWWAATLCAPLAAGVALFFVGADWWFKGIGFAAGFIRPFYTILSLRMFSPFLSPHPNVIGGLIAMLLPFIIVVEQYARREHRRELLRVTIVCGVIAAVGLLLTGSVGSWLALGLGLGVWGMWWLAERFHKPLHLSRRFTYTLLLVLLFGGGLYGVWLLIWLNLPGGDALTNRLILTGNEWRLVQDYSWTGSGLVSFAALYSEYVQIVPNFFLSYGNFYLDVLLELGVVGFAALLAIWAGAFWQVIKALQRSVSRPFPQHGNLYWLRWATCASLVIILVHGLTDNALYGGIGTPLLFYVPAMAVLVSRKRRTQAEVVQFRPWSKWVVWSTAVCLLLLGGLLVGFRQKALADWHANQGALLMDHALFLRWPTNQWRGNWYSTALRPARAHFRQAIELDEGNRTAHQRLGMIALFGRDFDTAVRHLEKAYQLDPTHQGVIKTLGYAYVWQGQLAEAYPLLAQIPEAESELKEYSRSWEKQNQFELAENAAAMLTLLEEN